ncbi:MAG: DUF192 domain-containing protein [Chloroflexi bacterium]|nr:DUF192 domain-containing protein [Chloroflexota bacterium]
MRLGNIRLAFRPLAPRFLLFASLLAVGLSACQAPPCPESSLFIGQTRVCVEIAETPEATERGLSGRDPLAGNQGMLFIFQYSGVYPFWMKEMKFPLDFIWIAEGKVVDLTENVPLSPEGPLPLYRPRVPITWVLEVNAGFVAQHGIKIGDSVALDRKG